jgi:hypothetical protein
MKISNIKSLIILKKLVFLIVLGILAQEGFSNRASDPSRAVKPTIPLAPDWEIRGERVG